MNYMIADIIPLDWLLHFVVGTSITIFMLKKEYPIKRIVILLGILCIAKELYDSTTLSASWGESILDSLFTFLYLLLIILVRKIKRKTA